MPVSSEIYLSLLFFADPLNTCEDLLGHKSLLSTQIYVHLEAKLFDQLENEYNVRRARSIKGMMALAAVGFSKFDQVGDVHLYRKPKKAED